VRQVNLLRLRDELQARGMRAPGDIWVSSFDVTDLFRESDLGFMRRAIQGGGQVLAVKVGGVAGLAQFPTQPDTTFLDELSGRIRVIACLDELPIVISGAFLPEFPGKHRVAERLHKRLKLGPGDDYFVVFGPEQDCRTAAEEIRLRFVDALKGVPQETRQALTGGFTTFERILPGPDRMYPDTDSPPTRVTAERVAVARARLGPTPWERLRAYGAWGVPQETTEFLIRRGGARIVDALVRRTGVEGRVAAVELGQRAKALKRAGIPMERLGEAEWVQVFDLFTGGRIPREAIQPLAAHLACNPGLGAEEACRSLGFGLLDREAWTADLAGLSMEDYRIDRADSDAKRLRFLAGRAMARLRGRAPGREVAAYLESKLKAEVAR
jgi:glutamyl-tRNA(Gln) amidotransferase subunit E